MKSLFFTAAIAVCAIIFSTANSFAQTSAKLSHTGSKDSTITIKVSGITCSGDLKMITNSVQKLPGVASCKQIGKMSPNSSFAIQFDPSKVTFPALVKTVEATPSCDYPDQHPYKAKIKK
ncbi:heavy-metal-associated domain-containing protein [Mucilaginibacter flavidus]|uniref:heavy-metal-associated domain-containing protein n=1 Tax=Mucilaginibacter flavidus TaxID=2949309 RepID=UPI002092FFE4|nr:heavy-metal-associated domain-containing protein [Mucilaginibacter flavidus]MCO5950858.1 hypothetical protein [Mucilaginibacter flavidus]